MKKIKLKDIKSGESYLVFTGFEWSPSGFDIGTKYHAEEGLTSQSNNEDLLKLPNIKIYTLPINE